jgi:hypothetical protein
VACRTCTDAFRLFTEKKTKKKIGKGQKHVSDSSSILKESNFSGIFGEQS